LRFNPKLQVEFTPKNKEKFEAAVKYVKYNSGNHITLIYINLLNESSLKWPDITSYTKVLEIERKVPREVLPLEKEHLQKVPSLFENNQLM